MEGDVFWKSCTEEGVSPREFAEKGILPKADSIGTFMMILSMSFNPAGAGDTRAVLQFGLAVSRRVVAQARQSR